MPTTLPERASDTPARSRGRPAQRLVASAALAVLTVDVLEVVTHGALTLRLGLRARP